MTHQPSKESTDWPQNDTQMEKQSASEISVYPAQDGLVDVAPRGHHIEIAERNRKTSPLLALPREIRDQIWEEVLGNQTFYPRISDGRDIFICDEPEADDPLSVLRVCRQVYVETSPILYQDSEFRLSYDFLFDSFFEALNQIKLPFRNQIKKLEIDIGSIAMGATVWMDMDWLEQLPGLSQVKLTIRNRYLCPSELGGWPEEMTEFAVNSVTETLREHGITDVEFRSNWDDEENGSAAGAEIENQDETLSTS